MAIRSQTRNVPALSMRAAVGTVNDEKRTVDVTFSTGARVLRSSWSDGAFHEELGMLPENVRLDRLNGGAPLLADHRADLSNIIGTVEPGSARIVNGKGVATVRFAKAEDDPRADQIYRKMKDGLIRSVSVGYRIHKMEKTESAKDRADNTPVYRATDWQPYEISAVALPADAAAGFRSDDKSQLNECVFLTREMNVDEDEKKKLEAEAAERAKADAEAKRALQLKDDNERAVRAERDRVVGIQGAIRVAKLDAAFGEKMIVDGVSLDKAREAVLEELAKRSDSQPIDGHLPSGTGIEVGATGKEKFLRGAEASLFSRSGTLPKLADVAKNTKILGVKRALRGIDELEDGGELRAFSVVELARELVEMGGKRTNGMSKEKVLDLAMAPNFNRSTGESTASDFAVLLENVMYKQLLGAYAQASDSWRRFCGTDTVQDFRPSNRYRTGSFGVLDALGDGGEYKSKAIPDGLKFAITTETVGNRIALSRNALINDDMGALVDVTNKFGRAAGLSIEVAVYALLAQNSGLGPTQSDTHPFFYSGRGNISTGAALAMAALELDRVQMAQQKDISNNEYLDLRPMALLVPLTLEGEANVINRAKFDPTAASAFERPNIVGGLFKDVIGSPRLSGTIRYLFADPQMCAAIKVVFLNDLQAPFMDQRLSWNSDGIEWKCRLDFKAQMFDPKGAIYNAGA